MIYEKRQIGPRVLPNLLSDLIEVALVDLEKAEASRRYRIRMSTWHEPEEGRCEVCLAGSVIAFTLKEDPARAVQPHNFDHATQKKLRALDYVRTGLIPNALQNMNGSPMDLEPCWPSVPGYADNPDAFKAALRDVAATLRERGL